MSNVNCRYVAIQPSKLVNQPVKLHRIVQTAADSSRGEAKREELFLNG